MAMIENKHLKQVEHDIARIFIKNDLIVKECACCGFTMTSLEAESSIYCIDCIENSDTLGTTYTAPTYNHAPDSFEWSNDDESF
jgi:hypothetical protein